MKLKLALLLAALLLFPLANATLDKPNWSIGDYWDYNGSYQITEEIDFGNLSGEGNVTFSGSLNTFPDGFDLQFEVVDIEIKNINDQSIGCYKTSVDGTFSGDFSLEGDFNLFNIPIESIDGNFEMRIVGYVYFATTTLSVVSTENDLYLNISTDTNLENFIPGFNPNMQIDILTSYNPPLPFMDFPINKGDTWEASSTATVSGQLFSDWEMPTTGPVSFSFACTDKIGDDIYLIKTNFNPVGDIMGGSDEVDMFWSESIGMIQKLMSSGESQILSIELADHGYRGEENSPPNAIITVETAQPKSGTNVFLKSESTDPDGNIVSWYWDFGDGTNSTQQNPAHTYTSGDTYTITLTVMDNYGEEDTAVKTIVVESSGGDSTPGFEVLLAFVAVIIVAFIRKNTRSFR